MMSKEKNLEELTRKAREAIAAITPEQKAELLRKQDVAWTLSKVQWAQDFHDGKCERD